METTLLAKVQVQKERKWVDGKTHLPPYPNGWYSLGVAASLKAGDMFSTAFMDQEVVVFRTEKGKLGVIDAYCPHMGAHFGHGGKVKGECVECPFHAFTFDVDGKCVTTGYNTKPSPRALARSYEVREKNGFIMVYFDKDGKMPEWEIPDLDPEGFTQILTTSWDLDSHPQETSENSVDIGHLSIVHGYDKVGVIIPLETEGPLLTSTYTMTRGAGVFKKIIPSVTAEFKVHVYGLGYSFVDVQVKDIGLHTRQFVLATPIGDNRINLRIGICMEKKTKLKSKYPFLHILPTALLNSLVMQSAFKGFQHDVGQDFDIWQNKVYIHPPALAKGDGPVAQYRIWAQQFYS